MNRLMTVLLPLLVTPRRTMCGIRCRCSRLYSHLRYWMVRIAAGSPIQHSCQTGRMRSSVERNANSAVSASRWVRSKGMAVPSMTNRPESAEAADIVEAALDPLRLRLDLVSLSFGGRKLGILLRGPPGDIAPGGA